MSRDILQDIISEFDTDKFIKFFRDKNRSFAPARVELGQYDDDSFVNGLELGGIDFASEGQNLVVCAFEVKKKLTERSGKKAQYEKGKKILKELQADSGIFIFYDQNNNFRFSLIYANYLGTKRDWSTFRRFTYFVSSCPQITNKTFLKQIGGGDFTSLEEIKDAFSVEEVTKEFFKEISSWYFWAIKNIAFPEDAEKDKNGRNSIGVIRLITRIIFIWFMKEKKLIPDYLFNEDKVKEFLKSLSPVESDYYKAILQNLFFATLNTPIKKRGFRESKNFQGKNVDFLNHSIYRYENYFKDQKEILKIFKDIPFLNGGLFECLDKEAEGKNEKKYLRIDGFSDRKDNALKIPNFLFFSEERNVDLNSDYGMKNKKYKVRGLINILQSYNFTIDENTPIDEEVALDPELLGMVFENLLASYNPETSTTARKATGSYYTPRKIVDYMVDESLKAYFENKLPTVKKISDKLNNLFSYSDENHQFNNNEVDILIKATNKLKVIDPAVGSGAFPMGVLQKLVFVLSKIDPHNKKWKQVQLDAANNILDSKSRRDSIDSIEKNFKNNELDYGRKLYLIQNCIYGVDIQITAIQISKLRFFISLLVDEKSNKNKEENFGIEPLPNLETKFVAANSLIGLHSSGAVMLPDPRILELEEDLKKIRAKHFNANYKREKERLRKKDREIRLQLAKLFEQSGFPSENTEKIINWDPYSSNISADFFDPEWMFGVKGFDIVIGNPPYVSVKNISIDDKRHFSELFETGKGRFNLFTLFLEKGHKLLKNKGILSYILPEVLYTNSEYKYIRKYLLEKTQILSVSNFSSKVFDASVDTSVILIKNEHNLKSEIKILLDLNFFITTIKQSEIDDIILTKNSGGIKSIIDKINQKKEKLDNIIEVQQGIIYSGQKKENVFSNQPFDKTYKKILDGRDIQRYYINYDQKKENRYIKYTKKLHRPREERLFLAKEKLIFPRRSKFFICTIDIDKFYLLNTAYVCLIKDLRYSLKYLLAILNSKFINFYYSKTYLGWQITIPAIKSIPIPKISPEQQKPFINLVDQILKKKKDNPNADTGELERKIDERVYGLYGLGEKEVEIIEKNE